VWGEKIAPRPTAGMELGLGFLPYERRSDARILSHFIEPILPLFAPEVGNEVGNEIQDKRKGVSFFS
jgi:hypothetical protein